jgi:hypothetical protein
VLAWGEPDGSALFEGRNVGSAYLCHGHVCMTPSDNANALRTQLDA